MAVKIIDSNARLGILFGVIDGSVGISYAVHLDISLWYGLAIPFKLICLLFARRVRAQITSLEIIFLSYLVLMSLLTLASGEHPILQSYVALMAFVISLGATLSALNRENSEAYFRAAFLSIVATAGLHILNVKFGHERDNFGRFYFFDNQPNLGGENAAIASVIGLIGLRKRPLFLAGLAVLIADTLLLNSRSALLTLLPCGFVALAYSWQGEIRAKQLGIAAVLAMLSAPLIYTFLTSHGATSTVTDVMALNSADRGAGTGFSGRGDLWAQAIDFFNASPLIGHSLGHFAELGYPGSHNFVLYGLAQYGLMFTAVLAVFTYLYVKTGLYSAYKLLVLLCATPLLLFNDRLVNLNAYPFLFYVLIMLLGQPGRGTLPTRVNVRLRGRQSNTRQIA